MRMLNVFKGAAGVISLAALSCASSAAAQGFDHATALTGYWGWVSFEDDPADFTGTCDNLPLRVWFTEGGTRYNSQWVSDVENGYFATSPVYESVLTPSGRGVIFVAYDDEQRTYDDGTTVAWYLVMLDENTFVWMREDWVRDGETSRAMVRCQEQSIS